MRFLGHHVLPFLALLFCTAGFAWAIPRQYKEWKRSGTLHMRLYRVHSRWAVFSWLTFGAILAVTTFGLAVHSLIFGFYGRVGGQN